MSSQPIGLFDSGLGGLTVMKQLIKLLPFEDMIYFGDTARVPYGDKSQDEIVCCALECAHFLLEKKIKLLVVACFTVSTVALFEIQKRLPIPVVGMIPSGIDALLTCKPKKKVALLGTSKTISSGVLESLIHEKAPHLEIVKVPCPRFVPLIEQGNISSLELENSVQETLKDLHQIDAALLACTHFPLILPMIQKALPEKTHVVDPSLFSAEHVKLQLKIHSLEKNTQEAPKYQFFVSKKTPQFERVSSLLFNSSQELVEKNQILCQNGS
jgi:glutamate racemase